MFILGYSGLSEALDFRRTELSGLTEREYRICQGMDAAAALLHNGEIIAAAAEERFNGEVHTCRFPINAIHYCLSQANISINELNAICHGFDYQPFKDLYQLDPFIKKNYEDVYDPHIQKKIFLANFVNLDIDTKFISVRHHHAHAASAFYPSGFKSALVMVADGLGEIDSISIYKGINGTLTNLHHSDLYSSLGMFYSMITYHLGFEPNNDEYKVMGLAPYGDPYRFKQFFEKCVELRPEGQIYIPVFSKNKTILEKQTYKGLRDWFSLSLLPAREKDTEIKQIHIDIAAGLQQILYKALHHILSYWQQQTKLDNLCMAGGVALNCTANGALFKSNLFKNIYIQPAAGDDGTAIGAALYKYHVLDKQVPSTLIKSPLPLYGPKFTNEQIKIVLESYNDKITFEYLNEDELLQQAAQMLADGAVIAWMQGSMEFGPRALGNRSILADPRRADMKDIINKAVKKREQFRPFAPSAKLDKAHIFFDIPEKCELPYMLFTVQVREEYKQALPAITHVDGSARLQTVKKSDHSLYWKLLDAFEQKSNYPILLNTSFNVKGQPIACTPQDAVLTLLSTDIHLLFIGNYLVKKL